METPVHHPLPVIPLITLTRPAVVDEKNIQSRTNKMEGDILLSLSIEDVTGEVAEYRIC